VVTAARPEILDELRASEHSRPVPATNERPEPPAVEPWLEQFPDPPRASLIEQIEATLRPYRPTPPMWADPMPQPELSSLPGDGDPRIVAAFKGSYNAIGMLLKGAAKDGSLAGAADQWNRQSGCSITPDGGRKGVPTGPVGCGLEKLPRCQRVAIEQYQEALRRNPAFGAKPTDREVYDWYRERGEDGTHDLPDFETWSRYLRAVRRALGLSKHTSRAGRAGRSIVRAGQVEGRTGHEPDN
jgi:hypothetical protein